MNAVKCSPSTFANTMKTSAKPPLVIHIFSPFSAKPPSGSRVARALAPSASEPEPDSLSAYAPTSLAGDQLRQIPVLLIGVPKSRIGAIARLLCAPNAALNDALPARLRLTTSAAALSRPDAAELLRRIHAEQAELARAPQQLPRERPSPSARAARCSGPLPSSANSRAVCAISRCSSERRSGVSTDAGSPASSSQAAPFVPCARRHATPLENACGAHAAADAHRHEPVARAPPLHFIQEARRQLRAGAAQRMAERDRAAVDVEPIFVHRQLAKARQHLRGERFVQLDEVDVVQATARPASAPSERPEPARCRIAPARRRPSRRRRSAPAASRPCSFANASDVTSTADAPSLICDELPAVTEPFT